MTTLTTDIMTQLGNMKGFQEFQSTTDPSAALAQNYTFKLTLNGTAFNSGNDITVTLTAAETLTSIAAKIQTAINAITAASVVVAKIQSDPYSSTTGRIRVSSTNTTELVSAVIISAPTAGSSLLTLLGGMGESIKKPQILNGNLIGETKTRPAIIVTSGIRGKKPASNGIVADIQETPFTVKCFADIQAATELLVGEARFWINSKLISGGWWRAKNEYEDKGNQQFTVIGLFGYAKQFVTNQRWV